MRLHSCLRSIWSGFPVNYFFLYGIYQWYEYRIGFKTELKNQVLYKKISTGATSKPRENGASRMNALFTYFYQKITSMIRSDMYMTLTDRDNFKRLIPQTIFAFLKYGGRCCHFATTKIRIISYIYYNIDKAVRYKEKLKTTRIYLISNPKHNI